MYNPPSRSIDSTKLNKVLEFADMRCAISADAKLNKEVDNKLTKKTKTL